MAGSLWDYLPLCSIYNTFINSAIKNKKTVVIKFFTKIATIYNRLSNNV